ncbi:MAG: LysM peptidoglycan-binding domain-containing protein [Anaerolineae bacterium]|nr:LysM peptidoglycan-binding domain-containing protein [Anaerolineae bacterium]
MGYFRIGSIILLMLFGIGQLGASSVQAAQTVYVVQRGDTLYRIAQWYGTTINAIAATNGIANPNRIYVGQQLVIPGAAGGVYTPYTAAANTNTVSADATASLPGSSANASANVSIPASGGSTYVVRPGDTLYKIAQQFGTTVAHLAAVNNLVNPNWLYPGQVLYVNGSTAGSATPAEAYAYSRVSDGEAEAYAYINTGSASTSSSNGDFSPPGTTPTASSSITILAPTSGKCYNKDVASLIRFQWTAPVEAVWYQLVIYRIEDGAVRYYGPIAPSYDVPTSDLFGFGTYNFYVVAFDHSDREIVRSSTGSFKISTCTCNGC